jgi:hypothetical protein
MFVDNLPKLDGEVHKVSEFGSGSGSIRFAAVEDGADMVGP